MCPGAPLKVFFPPRTLLHQGVGFFLTVGYNERGEELWVTFPHICSSHGPNVYVLLALGPQTPSTNGKITQFCNGTPTAEEMFPGINGSALMRKVDIRVVIVLCLLFVFTFLDRVNIANAAVYGMNEELGLVANQYNVALTIL